MTPVFLSIRKRVILGLLVLSIFSSANSQTINKNVFGQNAWVYTVGKIDGSTNTGGQLDNHYHNNDISNSNVGSMRFGGISVNQELQDLWMYGHNVTKYASGQTHVDSSEKFS